MEIRYTEYAIATLMERQIDKKIIEMAFQCPREIIHGKSGRKIVHFMVVDKLLRVVFEDHGQHYIVITAYFTNPERYIPA